MDVQAPALVAVVVTTDPGPWFEETLASLAGQDYEELSVLVLATGDEGADVPERVGRILPEAFVRQLDGRPGYAAAANEALTMVEGAAFFLLLHDDCALDADAVHKLVEESFRSNAGVVSPKFVNWDDPTVLLHVGMSCDKTGAVVDRIQDGEVDHGQHDAVRDVFVAPGGCMLVRADLWRELGGYDAGIIAMGEDLDLSWRSQVAGSRLVVAPEARVRHREVVAGGLKPMAVLIDEQGRKHPSSMQALQRRHELRAVLKCYTWFHLLRVLPQAALLATGEVIVALLARDRARARAVSSAWRWNFQHRGEVRTLRRDLKAHRLFPDAEVRRLQLRGSARLSQYFSRLSHQGLEAANAVVSTRSSPTSRDEGVALLTGSVGLAFSEDQDFDDLDDLGRRSGRDRFGRRVRTSPLTTGCQRVVAITVAALVIVIGSRELFFGSLPMIGQLAPLPSWTDTWHHLVAGWQPAGVGTTAPATPAFGIAGLIGTVLFGAMGTAQHVLLLGCIPLGAFGLSTFMRPLVSARARVIAVICYLGLPLPYGALAVGRVDGVIAYAAMPFLLTQLARASGLSPFDTGAGTGWRATRRGRIALLGLLLAVSASFAPALAPVLLGCALAWEAGSLVVSAGPRVGAVFAVAVQATVVALVLCAPWAVGTALAGHHAVDLFGLPMSPAAAPTWGEVVRFAVGPAARSPVVWLLIAAAALPLLLGTGVRLAWAARLWLMACLSWGGAFAASHGLMGAFTPSETVVLAPAALAVAAAIGLGISAFENDLAGQAFGWRQVASGVAIVAVAVGLVPTVAAAAGGRWDMPSSGVEQPLAFLNRPQPAGVSRVLWLGDPRALPVGGWAVQPGLAYALTGAALPDASSVWTPAGPGPAATVDTAVRLAISGGTVHLGQLLAAAGVRFIVVVDGITPSGGTLPRSVAAPAPSGLTRALLDQNDLREVPGEFGLSVFQNAETVPVTAQRGSGVTTRATSPFPGVNDVTGWRPALSPLAPGPAAVGAVGAGTVLAAYAPAGNLQLRVNGHAVPERGAFKWAAQFSTPPGAASLTVAHAPFIPAAVILEMVAWLVLALALLGWRRWPLRRRQVVRRRRQPAEDPR
jgi:GT2 family glycosyltransferase